MKIPKFPLIVKATVVTLHSDGEILLVQFDTRGAIPSVFRRELVEEGNLLNAGQPVLLIGNGPQPAWAFGILVDEALSALADGGCPPSLVAVFNEDSRSYVVVSSYCIQYEPGKEFPAPQWCYPKRDGEPSPEPLDETEAEMLKLVPKVRLTVLH